MDTVTSVAVIVLCGTLFSALAAALSPILTARVYARSRQAERAEDRADRLEVASKVEAAARRADDVAVQAKRAAALLLNAQQESIARTEEVAKVAAAANDVTTSQLKQIHTLVNSDMTAARQAELDQTRLSLVLLRRMIARDVTDGRSPDPDDLAAIDLAEARITNLTAILADRLEQQRMAEAEMDKKEST